MTRRALAGAISVMLTWLLTPPWFLPQAKPAGSTLGT